MAAKLALNQFSYAIKSFFKIVKNILRIWTLLAALITTTLILLEFGFHLNTANQHLFSTLYFYLYIFFIITYFFLFITQKKPIQFLQTNAYILVLFLPILNLKLPIVSPTQSHQITLSILAFMQFTRHFQSLKKIKATTLFLLAFIFGIFIGSILLSLPISLKNSQSLSYIDAIFTATSAICVTGLSTLNIQETFSPIGQGIVIGLCQIGGLGIMTFSVLLSLILRKKISQSSSQEIQKSYEAVTIKDTFSAIKFIFKFTFIAEIIGAIFIFINLSTTSFTPIERVGNAIFLSISAFCNAGFTLFNNSLISQQSNSFLLLSISGLIILGGLGFPVLFNLKTTQDQGKSWRYLKLNTKIALCVTGSLIILGTLTLWISEMQHAFAEMPLHTQWINAFFLSVSSRTAGFNTLNFDLFYTSSVIILLALMIIGASPGSTGGGIKTTNFGLILIAFWQSIRSSPRLEFGGRTLPYQAILKIFSILILYLIGIFIFFYILLWTETLPPLTLLFETISAFGTVGFSMGITTDLSKWGKLIIILAMFIGRMGPLTVAFALSKEKEIKNYRFPEEKLTVM